MENKKKTSGNRGKKTGKLLILTGCLCLASAGGLTLYNFWDSYRAGEESARIEEALVERIAANMGESGIPPDSAADDGMGRAAGDGTGPAAGDSIGPAAADGKKPALLQTVPMEDPGGTPYRDMPAEDVEEYYYIGFLEIPSIDLSLPVMESWDYNRLRISPCRYSGSYYTDDLVICAHNYYRHFTPVKDDLGMGEDVYFTNVLGESIHYRTVNKETIQPTDIEAMVINDRNNDGQDEWDLTLFTCNLGGQTRAAIRCQRVRPGQ